MRNRIILILIAVAIVSLSLPARAHTQAQLDRWKERWAIRADLAFTPSLLAEWADMERRHPCRVNLCPGKARQDSPTTIKPAPVVTDETFRGMGADVEQWRSLVAVYFPSDQVDRTLLVMACESGGNANAYNPSGASGLMQVLSSWADNFGYVPTQLFDPSINLYVASLLYYDGGWGHWRASAGCWG